MGNGHIKNYFDFCGLHPFAKDLSEFENHLGSLSEGEICKALLGNNNNNNICS